MHILQFGIPSIQGVVSSNLFQSSWELVSSEYYSVSCQSFSILFFVQLLDSILLCSYNLISVELWVD